MDNPGTRRFTVSIRSLAVLLAINLIVLIGLAIPVLQGRLAPAPTVTPLPPTAAPAEPSTPTPPPTLTPTIASREASPAAAFNLALEHPTSLSEGLFILSLNDNGYAHLFAYQPQTLPLTRLTNHPWDDITPALSPDATRVAFSSRQNGYWDLYSLDLASGAITRLTDTGDYDAHPTWSPDGRWIAFETCFQNSFQIAILSVDDPNQAPIFLTADSALHHSPAWSPQGRQIAYVASENGKDSLWIVDLDKTDQQFIQIVKPEASHLEHPSWSPDGKQLAWSAGSAGSANVYVWDNQQPATASRLLGNGDWPVWSPRGDLIATRITAPNQVFLSAYQSQTGNLVLPPEPLPGSLLGLDWKNGKLPATLPEPIAQAMALTPTALWLDDADAVTGVPGRQTLVTLADVSAPQPALSARADEAFYALRQRLGVELGWDFLANLENAFVPLTSPLPPGMGDDWLYTGRAVAINPLPMNAGWIAVVREDYGSEMYWRLYLKTRYQDGSQGGPIQELAWDLNARFNGDPLVYDQGGVTTKSVPAGFWLDFTELASRYGWKRLPALSNWRTFYPGTRFNEYAFSEGLDWQSAMLEMYPPEVLITPTTIHGKINTPTTAPTWYRTRTPTPTRIPTATATRRATWTPLP